jgi:hypothetical protein
MKEEFHFVIAKNWENTEQLCIYAYHSQVQFGTIDDAKCLLEYINNDNYNIYKINFEKVLL